jgi:hypothetical protein
LFLTLRLLKQPCLSLLEAGAVARVEKQCKASRATGLRFSFFLMLALARLEIKRWSTRRTLERRASADTSSSAAAAARARPASALIWLFP